MTVSFEVKPKEFEIIENYQDFDFTESQAKKEIKKLVKSYKTIHACSKAFYGNEGSEDHIRLKKIFLPYYLPYSTFDRYISQNIREDFAIR